MLILFFIKNKKQYLLEFDVNFWNSIKIYYGDIAVSFNEKDEKITITTDKDIMTVKYIHIKKIIDYDISQRNVSKSPYLAH
jgi:hypothetical protein